MVSRQGLPPRQTLLLLSMNKQQEFEAGEEENDEDEAEEVEENEDT